MLFFSIDKNGYPCYGFSVFYSFTFGGKAETKHSEMSFPVYAFYRKVQNLRDALLT